MPIFIREACKTSGALCLVCCVQLREIFNAHLSEKQGKAATAEQRRAANPVGRRPGNDAHGDGEAEAREAPLSFGFELELGLLSAVWGAAHKSASSLLSFGFGAGIF